jgi:proteasome lid subunit RPN8/RPN11
MRFWKKKAKAAAPRPLPPILYLHETLLASTTAWLQAAGDERSAHEGVVYWAGKSFGREWVISTCIAPQAHTTRGSFRTSSGNNAEVIAYLATHRLELLGQVHSHPGQLVDHSDGDDEGALMPYEHFLSIVVPDYGCSGMWPLTKCGVHRFEAGRFRRLTDAEVEAAFKLLPSARDFRRSV